MKSRTARVLTLIVSLSLFICGRLWAEGAWNVSRSTHFIVYYHKAQDKFIDEVIEKAEGYYDKIADDLGFRRYDFWLWENRAKIYIYDSAKEYRQSTNQPEWSDGCVIPQKKEIYSYAFARKFFDTVLAHEMGHIIFHEFVGFDNPAIPLWLDEGVASYEQNVRSASAPLIRGAILRRQFIPITYLNRVNLEKADNNAEVNLFYAESVNLVWFLINKYGQDSFMDFCRQLRDKRNFLSSLASVYSYSSLEALEEDWKEHF